MFLTDAADDLRVWQNRLKGQLRAVQGVEVLDDIPPPTEYAEHEAAVTNAALHADLCVHLLGTSAGLAVEEGPSPGVTYPLEQLRLCFAHARSQLVLHAEDFRPDTLEPAIHQPLVKTILASDRPRTRLEIAQTSRTKLLGQVIEHKSFLSSQRSASGKLPAPPAAFVDVHERDLSFAAPLLAFLKRRMKIFGMSRGSSELEQSAFEELVSRAKYLIVVFGDVERAWVERRLDEAAKIQFERGLEVTCGVYVRPGAPAWSEPAPKRARLINNADGFSEGLIEEFLTQAAAP